MINTNITEAQIVKAILDYLAYTKIFSWRINSGMIFGTNAKGVSYAHKLAPKGTSDIIGILPGGQFLAIEVKKPGGVLSESQKEFLDKVNALGGRAFVAYSIDDVQKELKRK